ncbi:MAG: hypothetical protein KA144_15615 [Xanthomonadaceae bacterium]|nr:hypothetical protein [Xanthomonadaceae bacterium]
MPIRASEKHGGKVTAYCINCDDEILNVPSARFTLHADEGFGDVDEDGGFIKFFVATCNSCGYMELYRDGFLFKSNEGDA